MRMLRAPLHSAPHPRRRSSAAGAALIGVWLAVAVGAAPVRAQQDDPPKAVHADSTRAKRGVSPGGAFLRALILPGWGHASIGAWNRGAFYFTVESSTAWELLRTRERLIEARGRVRWREAVVRQDLAAQGITNADSVRAHLDGDASLKDLRGLANARATQQQDWVALGIFLVFLSGADAYVSANLAHFPHPISIDAAPTGPVGRMQISVSVPVPGH